MSNIQDFGNDEFIQEFRKRFGENIPQQDLIQELANVNNRLVASEKLKTNFLSNIRNELNNPLAAALELSKIISDENLTTEQIRKFSKIIHSEIFNLDFQLRNMFFSAEAEAGELGLSVVFVDIAKMLQTILESFQPLISKKNLLVITFNDIKSPDHLFATDAEKLHVILSNLLNNAIQYSNAEASIDIYLDVIDDKLKISIKDYGLGIDADNKKLIFDRFKQGQEGSTKNYGGHGLGLSITQSLLDIINGELIVESELNKGSVFTVLINREINRSSDDITLSDNGNDFLFQDPNSMIF